MRVKRLLLAVVASLSMVGCAVGQQGAAPPPDCTGNCRVVVTITSCAAADIKVDKQTIRVGAGPAVMQWEIDNGSFQAGWKFASQGIFFKNDAGGEFVPGPQGGPKMITFNNRHTKPGVYEYGIRIVNPNGQPCPPKDPFVANL